MIINFLFFFSIFIFIYVFYLYLKFLIFIDLLSKRKLSKTFNEKNHEKVLIVITVNNEEKNIKNRLDNIYESDYPPDLLRVLVVSDGSMDKTNNIVQSLNYKNLEILALKQQVGKSIAQNKLHHFIKDNEIIFFTDAESLFEKDCIQQIVQSYSNPKVGAVGGKLIFKTKMNDGISSSQDLYWKYELKLRSLETSLGILTSMSGACMSIRSILFTDLPSDVGEDCFIPLHVASLGYKVIQNDNALAYDRMNSSSKGELRARIRMTKRNLKGTLMFKSLLNPFISFKYSFSLISHKLLRWFSPFFLLYITIVPFIFDDTFVLSFLPLKELIFLIYIAGAIGFILNICGLKVLLLSQIYSFILANIGFLFGVIGFFLGYFNSNKQSIY